MIQQQTPLNVTVVKKKIFNSIYFHLFILIALSLVLPLGYGIVDQPNQENIPSNITIQNSEVLTSATQTENGIIVHFNNSFRKQTVVEVTNEEHTVIAKMLISQSSDSISFTPDSNKPTSKNTTRYHVKFIQVETNEIKYNETIYV